MESQIDSYMEIAIQEARISLQEGNNGFGAVVIKNGKIISKSRDKEETDNDPTSHAEINAIREASRVSGKNLNNCLLVCTYEPCPMCATAIIWTGISEIAYGYSIKDAIQEGKNRIDISCEEIFQRAGYSIRINRGVLHEKCSILYRKSVRNEIKKLRTVTPMDLEFLNKSIMKKRLDWFKKHSFVFKNKEKDLLEVAYELLMDKLEITPKGAPIKEKTRKRLLFHSMNFCPTLEACKILGLDTRYICKILNEKPTNMLVKQIDERLSYHRNYEKLRQYCDYCEEMIQLND